MKVTIPQAIQDHTATIEEFLDWYCSLNKGEKASLVTYKVRKNHFADKNYNRTKLIEYNLAQKLAVTEEIEADICKLYYDQYRGKKYIANKFDLTVLVVDEILKKCPCNFKYSKVE